jgi:hypothetical protein
MRMKHSYVARIIVTIRTDILVLTNSVLGIKCLLCSVQAIETLPPKKHIQVCVYIWNYFTLSMRLNAISVQYVAVVGSIHVGGTDVCVHFSALIILPIARCLPIWGFVSQFWHNHCGLGMRGIDSQGCGKLEKRDPLKKRIYMVLWALMFYVTGFATQYYEETGFWKILIEYLESKWHAKTTESHFEWNYTYKNIVSFVFCSVCF